MSVNAPARPAPARRGATRTSDAWLIRRDRTAAVRRPSRLVAVWTPAPDRRLTCRWEKPDSEGPIELKAEN
jgi:hypothetical protein